MWIERVIQNVELKCYWFEVIECLRKAMLVGMTVLIQQGSYQQLIVGAVISTFMLAVVAYFVPYKHFTDDLLAQLCQLVVLLNLLMAMLLKGRQDETENRVLLSATKATDPIKAIAAVRAELRDLEDAISVTLLLLSLLPIPIALVFLAYDMRKEAQLGYNPDDLWRPEVPLNLWRSESVKRKSIARASMMAPDAGAFYRASVMAIDDEPPSADSADDAVLEAAKQAAADAMDAADPTAHQEDDDPAAKADDDAILEAAKQAAAAVMDAADPTVHQEDDGPAAKADGDVQITVAQPEQSRSSLHRRHTRPMEPPVMTKLTSSMADHHLRI